MFNKIFLLIPLLLFSSCSDNNNHQSALNIRLADGYPKWLKNNGYYTDQTSGIAYIGQDNEGRKTFLLVDDIGKIHHMFINSDGTIDFSPVFFSKDVSNFLSEFPKKDFEEIVFDKSSGELLLSIEGNSDKYKDYVGIYSIKLSGDVFADTVTNIEKLMIKPEKEFLKYTYKNIGFEGMAADDNYYYFGLEGVTDEGMFTDSTIIYIVDKKDLNIVKEINTRELGIGTICGLCSAGNYALYGIDRNNRKLFYIKLDNNLEIESTTMTELLSPIPGYPSYNYVASYESVALDNENNLYMIDDPWKSHFIPSDEIMNELDPETKSDFRKFVPVIYKYKLLK